MTTVADLSVRVGADIGGLTHGLSNANQQVTGFGKRFGGALSSIGGGMSDVGMTLGLLTGPITAIGGIAANAAIDFESSFADVRKTVNATDAELDGLKDTLFAMSTDAHSPVSGLEGSLMTLTSVASAAGQLGVATENIAAFAENMLMLDVATNMTAEEAAVFAARFENVTGMGFENIDNLGDTLVTLGNNMATTESEIAAFATRLAPLANYDWGASTILGYSAALSSLGVSAELGGTNLTKTVADLTTAVAMGGQDLAGFAKIAGVTATEFKTLAEASPEGAFYAFIEGLAGLDADEQILQLRALGITSVEQIGTLQRLAGGFDTLGDALDLAEEAWTGNNAVLNEATKKADTTRGALNRITNQLTALAITGGNALLPVINDLADLLGPVISYVTGWVEQNPELISQIVSLAAGGSAIGVALIAIGPLLRAIGSAVSFILNPLNALIGLLTFADWAQIGGGVGDLASGFQALLAGDVEGGGEAIKSGLRKIGEGLLEIPMGAANALADFLGQLTGRQLQDMNWEGVQRGWAVLKDIVGQQLENVARGFTLVRDAVNGWVTGKLEDTAKGFTLLRDAAVKFVEDNPQLANFVQLTALRFLVLPPLLSLTSSGFAVLKTTIAGIGSMFSAIGSGLSGIFSSLASGGGGALGLLKGLAGPLAILFVLSYADWSKIGAGLKDIGTGIMLLLSGDSAGWTRIGDGLKNIGAGLAEIPMGLANALVDFLEAITGRDLQDLNWEGVGRGWGTVVAGWEELWRRVGLGWQTVLDGATVMGDGISRIWDQVKRGIELFLLESRLSVLQWVGALRETIKSITGGTVDIAPNFHVDTLEIAQRVLDLKLSDYLTDTLREQVAAGNGIDLLLPTGRIEIGPGLSIDPGTLLSLFTPGSPYYDEMLAGAGVGFQQALTDALKQSLVLGDTATVELIEPVALALGIDVAKVESDVRTYLENTRPTATVQVEVNPLLSFAGDIAGRISAWFSGLGINLTLPVSVGGGSAAVTPPTPPNADGSYYTGTSYVPRDMLANVHKGEVITNARDAKALGGTVVHKYYVTSYGKSPHELVELLQQAQRDGGR